jgi:hypothetical protein
MLTAASWASAQKRNFNTPAALAGYTGADREKILFEGAKPEGKVVWYTSLSGGSYKALAEAFEAKYRGCPGDYPRHSYVLGRGQAPWSF